MDNLIDFFSKFSKEYLFTGLSVLIFILLIYFGWISNAKAKANKKDNSGLFFLAFAFLFHGAIGLIALNNSIDSNLIISNKLVSNLLNINGLINLCLLSSVSFFALHTHSIDRIVSNVKWQYTSIGLLVSWLLITNAFSGNSSLLIIDIIISILAYGIVGFFITRYFFKRALYLVAVVSGGFFISVIALQIGCFTFVDGINKFNHLNVMFFVPEFLLAVIALSYTFSWINELNFYEISNIWVRNETEDTDEITEYSKATKSTAQDWINHIENDEIEEAIQKIIILKRLKNENLEVILNLASRNTRNNNNYSQEYITREDRDIVRNKINKALLEYVNGN